MTGGVDFVGWNVSGEDLYKRRIVKSERLNTLDEIKEQTTDNRCRVTVKVPPSRTGSRGRGGSWVVRPPRIVCTAVLLW